VWRKQPKLEAAVRTLTSLLTDVVVGARAYKAVMATLHQTCGLVCGAAKRK